MKHFHLLFLAAALSAAMSVRAAPAVDIEIDAGRPGAVINKHLYGQAVGQSGAGIWVGPDSTIPNIKGWRKDVVGALKALRVPLLRWPAGCVAEEYDWRDGVGARDGRPAPLLPRGAGGANNNALGTHEFFELVELLGADAYVNGNIGTGSAREAAEWVEYMVADGASTLAQLRAKNGHARPYKLAYFGVGAAPWSCGGNMSAQYYADLYNQFAVFIRGKVDQPPRLVAAGDGADWTAELSTKKRIRDYRFDISAHDDAAAPGGAPAPGAASAEQQWIAVLQRTLRVNNFIDSNVAVLDKNDAANKMSLALGDWGGADARAPQRQDALGDALAAALTFHAFHAHAARLGMADIAQALTARQAMIRTDGAAMMLTPTYYAFRMHVPFQAATTLPLSLANNPQYSVGGLGVPAVSASAARAIDGKLYLSLVNADAREAATVAIGVNGASLKAASGSVLAAAGADARNKAATLAPAPLTAHAENGKLRLTLPPKSLTVLAIDE